MATPFTPPALETLEPIAQPQPEPTPFTHYSQGRSVGGPDEMEDRWTNQGYTATGKNLTDGVVAVNPDVYPLGTVLKDDDTGEFFLAADRHGNKDPRVVDFYQSPDRYTKASGERRLSVAGKLEKIPDTPEGVRAALNSFATATGDNAVSPVVKDPMQTGYFEYADPATGKTVRRPAAFVQDVPVPPAEKFTPPALDTIEPAANPAFTPPAVSSETPASMGTLANLWNTFAKGATSEGIYSGLEGATRASGTSLLQPENEITVRQADGSYKLNAWKAFLNGLGETLVNYADNTANLRSDLRAALPVDDEFADSYIGGIAQGAGQLAGTLPQFAIPGMAGVTALGTAYDQQYQDALAHGATPDKAHQAGLIGMPSGTLDYLADKLILGKVLKPLRGKITVGDAIKHIAIASAAEGTTEGAQQVWQNVVAKQLSGYDPERPLDDEVIKSMIIGGIVGGGATGVGMAGTTVLAPKTPTTGRLEAVKVEGTQPEAAAVAEAFGETPTAQPEAPAPARDPMMDRNAGWKRTTTFTPPPLESIEPETPPAAPEPAAPRWNARDYETAGLAEQYRREMEAELQNAGADTGHELLAAIDSVGGLPAKDSPKRDAWAGELDRVLSAARSKVDPKGGAFVGTLFRKTAPDLDQLRGDLADYGFKFDTESDLIDAIENRLTTGKKVYGNPASVPLENIPFSKADQRTVAEALAANEPLKPRTPWKMELHGGEDKVRAKAKADLMALPGEVTTRDGRRVVIKHIRQGTLGTLAEHLITQTRDGATWVNRTRAAWVPRIAQTLEEAHVKYHSPNGNAVYVAPYEGGFAHFVVVKPDNTVDSQGYLDDLWTQWHGNAGDMGKAGVQPAIEFSKNTSPMTSPEGRGGTETAGDTSGRSARDSGYTVGSKSGLPAHARQIENAANTAALKMRGAPRVVVHEDVPAIPDGALRSAVQAADAQGKGVVDAFYNPEDGSIHLIASRIRDGAHAGEKVRHETLHGALRTDEKFRAEYDRLIGSFAEALDGKTFTELSKLYAKRDDAGEITNPETIVEEYLARLAEKEPNIGLWRQFVAKFKAIAARYLPGVKFTEADIRAFIHSRMQRRGGGQAKPGPIATSKAPVRIEGFNPPSLPDRFNNLTEILDYREKYKAAELEFYRSLGFNEAEAKKMWRAGDDRSNLDVSGLEDRLEGHAAERYEAFTRGEGADAVYRWDSRFDPASVEGDNDVPFLARRFVNGVANGGTSDFGDHFIFNVALLRRLKDLGASWEDVARALDGYSVRNSGNESGRQFLFEQQVPKLRDFASSQGIDLPMRSTERPELQFSKVDAEDAAASDDPQARRKFVESVKRNANVRPEVKQRLRAEFYDPVSNDETVRQARARIQAKGLDASMVDILAQNPETWKPEAADYATALEVAAELHKRGRLDDEAAVYDKMAIASTDQGRAIQFLSMMGRYSPEGIQIFAARQIRAAVEADPELKRLYGEISRLRDELAEARKPAATQAVLDVQKILAEVLKDQATRVRANLALRDALMQTWTDPAQAVATFKRLLEQFGITPHNADRIAKRLANSSREHGKKNRAEVLKKVKTAGERRIPPGAAERLIILNREGKLDDAGMAAELSKIAGVPVWTPEMAGRAKRLALEYERATDPEVKLVLAARMLDTVRGMTPPSVWAKARGLQNLAMLLNPKTVIRNLGGNAVMWGADLSADTLTNFAVDPLTSIFTGKRSRVTLNVRERFAGLAQPMRDFWNGYGHAQSEGRGTWQSFGDGVQFMIDIARLTAAGKFELSKVDNGLRKTFSAPVLSHLEDTLAFVLGTTDRAFHASAYQSSLARQMALARSRGENVLAPTAEMHREALMDAAAAIYQNDTWLAKAGSQVRKGFNLASTFGRSSEYGIGTAVLPFVQVPGSIASKAIEWSPAGFIRTAYEVFRPVFARREFRQREFADAFSRTALGSGVWAAGLWLAKLGIMTAMRDEDKDLAAMQDASGFGAYMLNASALWRVMASGNWWTPQKPQAGDTLVSYNWISPNGVALAAGAQYFQAEREQAMSELRGRAVPDYAKYLSALEGGGQAFLDQSFLSGLADAAKATGNNGLLDGSAQIAAQMPLNFIPTFVRQLRDLEDNTTRETSAGDFLQRTEAKFMAAIPGLSDKLPARADLLGEAQERYQYATNSLWNVFLNPAFVKQYKADPELMEAERVYRATGERSVLPGRVEPTMTLNGQTVRLTNEELAAYQSAFGQFGQNLIGRMIATPAWAEAPMPMKAQAMAAALRMAHNAAKLKTLGSQQQLLDRARQQIQQDAAHEGELMQTR